jgi:hypothetical protein
MHLPRHNDLLPSKDATFKQPSSNREEVAIFKQQRTAAIQRCNLQATFKQSSNNFHAKEKRMRFLSNSELLPSKDATFKPPSQAAEKRMQSSSNKEVLPSKNNIYTFSKYRIRFKNIYVFIHVSLTEKNTCRKGRIQINHNTEHPRKYRLIYIYIRTQ